MINIILVITGIFFLIYSAFIYIKLLKLISNSVLKKWWNLLFIFVVFFTIGYSVFAYLLFIGDESVNLFIETIVSIIFFLGSIFVLFSARLIHYTLIEFKKENQKSKKISKELNQVKSNIEKKIKERTEELQKLNNVMIGRELKIVELKKKIIELKKRNKHK